MTFPARAVPAFAFRISLLSAGALVAQSLPTQPAVAIGGEHDRAQDPCDAVVAWVLDDAAALPGG